MSARWVTSGTGLIVFSMARAGELESLQNQSTNPIRNSGAKRGPPCPRFRIDTGLAIGLVGMYSDCNLNVQ